ncbi:hypothetical protein EDD16DRAFT_1474846, partial [Pisolithus croceorrhizus]
LDFDPTLPVEGWQEGVEDLNNLSEDQLWERLGLPERKLPFFQEWTDLDCMIDPWSETGQRWFDDDTQGHKHLNP